VGELAFRLDDEIGIVESLDIQLRLVRIVNHGTDGGGTQVLRKQEPVLDRVKEVRAVEGNEIAWRDLSKETRSDAFHACRRTSGTQDYFDSFVVETNKGRPGVRMDCPVMNGKSIVDIGSK